MIERTSQGELPRKHHVALRGGDGRLRYEHCFTRQGFDGPYTILYHLERPHEAGQAEPAGGFPLPEAASVSAIARRHYRSGELAAGGAAALARIPLLFNSELVISVGRPDASDDAYFSNADADDLLFVLSGGGTLRSWLGDLAFRALDYVFVPKGLLHRFELLPDLEQRWLWIEAKSGLSIPSAFRNGSGQLRMDAPYCHRDFRAPLLRAPLDEGIRRWVVKRGDVFGASVLARTPLDVVGWDGAVYPFAFSILDYQPRVGQIHLPPTVHGTFSAGGSLISSFVPRLLDFGPDAVPCPYPHSSVDIDEVLFYASGDFTSRRGIGAGSLSHHPAGIPHGPHPGAYEASLGKARTEELAVMLDVDRPLARTPFAARVEDLGYHASFAATPA
jgi:homogentisate 1,2-dioxygenase